MPIQPQPIDQLDPTAVTAAQTFLAQRMTEYDPTLEVSTRGPVYDLVMNSAAALQTAAENAFDQLRQSLSVLLISQNPAATDPTTVAAALSNFLITASPGTVATGQVAIVVSALIPVTVPAGTVFSAGGVSFTADASYAARTSSASVTTPTDRLLTPVTSGGWVFTISVTATAVGAVGNIPRNTGLTPNSFIPNLTAAYAEADFTGGTDGEDPASLVGQLSAGVAGRNLSNRATIAALLRNTPEFSTISALSVCGAGSPEQIRYHGPLPLASGGRIDIYARTSGLPAAVMLNKTATLISQNVALGGGVWQVGIGRADAPGFYEAQTIIRAGGDPTTAGYEVLATIRSADVTSPDGSWVPDIEAPVEAAFTPYQAAVIQFLDTDTDASLAIGTQAPYTLYLRAMPDLGDLQTFLASDDVRHQSADVLAKAPVPCFVRLSLTVRQPPSTAAPDTASMATALAAAVNAGGFDGRLDNSPLVAVAQGMLAPGQSIASVDLYGRLLRPDGTTVYLRSRDGLIVPYTPSQMVSLRTVCFYLDPQDVGISVVGVPGPSG